MKKIFFTLITCILICIGVTYFTGSDKVINVIVKDIDLNDIKINEMSKYTNNFYYDKLNDTQKKYYRVIASGVMQLDDTIAMEVTNENNYDTFKNDIEISLTAFLDDHPEVFYVGEKYEIQLINSALFKVLKLKLEYLSDSKSKIQEMEQKLKSQIDLISSKLGNAKTEYEKELVIHDLIAKNANYFKYEDYDNIPMIKHTAYGALVEKSAVCDGITKAFQLALGENGIESVLVTGTAEGVAHAWCKVKIDSFWYNVDVTSDKTLNSENNDLVIHSYFNVTDKEILKTHTIDKNEDLPKCTSTKHNYYVYNDYTIGAVENFEYKLGKIVQKQNGSPLLEFNAEGISNVPNKLVNALYNLNFNNYKNDNVRKISYNKINNNYIIVK